MFRERNERPSTAGGLPAEERSGYMELTEVAGGFMQRRGVHGRTERQKASSLDNCGGSGTEQRSQLSFVLRVSAHLSAQCPGVSFLKRDLNPESRG